MNRKTRGIDIETEKKTYKLRTSDNDTTKDWKEAIEKAVEADKKIDHAIIQETEEGMMAALTGDAMVGAAWGAECAQVSYQVTEDAKKLLQDGGEPAESVILAKQTACHATSIAEKVRAACANAIEGYEEAVSLLQEQKGVKVEGCQGTDEFEKLAAQYEARATLLHGILEDTWIIPASPEMTSTEKAASSMLVAKGYSHWVATKSAEGYEILQKHNPAADAQKLLDDGGEPAQSVVLAKQTACDAVTVGEKVRAACANAIEGYEESVLLLQAQKGVKVEGCEGTEEFEKLADQYKARATLLNQVLEDLRIVPSPPEMTQTEQHASKILVAKGHYLWASSMAADGYEIVQKQSAAATAAAAPVLAQAADKAAPVLAQAADAAAPVLAQAADKIEEWKATPEADDEGIDLEDVGLEEEFVETPSGKAKSKAKSKSMGKAKSKAKGKAKAKAK